MACAALLSLTRHLDHILEGYSRFPSDVDCKMQHMLSIHEKSVSLLNFLEDFPREAPKLESQIKSAANRAVDFFVYQNYGIDDVRCREEAEKLIEEIDSIFKLAMQIKSRNGGKTLVATPTGKDTAVGIEEDLTVVLDRVCGEPSDLQIIPIVGMGGIGKTILARYAYHHPSIFNHFDYRVWVTVSRNSLSLIILGILGSDDGSFQTREGDNELLLQRAYRYLKGRRYLVVMDDMWDTNVWDDLRRTFPDDCNGSRIIVTTRELDVAWYVGPRSCPHEMHLMCKDLSWRLLKEKVFGQDSCPLELENVGMVIAQNCRGLPLAIVVIAGVLSKVSRMQEIWGNIARNVIEAVNGDEQLSDILSVSYQNLPHYLRPCFLYLGGFPEDHEIKVSRLVKLWAAEGFLISKDESEDMDELGYDYLEDLAKRNLVLINKKRFDGKIKTIKIHDVLRDLCLRKARDEKFLHVLNELSVDFPEGIESYQRLSIFSHVLGHIPNRDRDIAAIHTLLLFDYWAFDSWKNLRLLRVIDAYVMSMTLRFSSAIRYIGKLSHLTHLSIICEPTLEVVTLIAKSLYQLLNLLTLIVRINYVTRIGSFCFSETLYTSFVEFEMWRMPQLRHLILLDGFLPNPSPDNCPENLVLERLHTLTRIKDFTCSQRMLEMIPNLKKLGIVYSYEGIYKLGWSKYHLHNLVQLSKLEKLSLYAEPYPDLKNDVSLNLAFPASLKTLSLSGCRIPWVDMASIVGRLPNLQVLKLKRHACHGTEWETSEGEFTQLKLLVIDTTDLHHWTIQSYSHFPQLEHLVLQKCNKLRGIPGEVGEIPTLKLIEVDLWNLSIVESATRIQEEQQSFGNDVVVRLLKPPRQDFDFKLYAM